ncbi:MAG: GHKL domain-containing protein [Spirochaetales bacterium]|nr:GHKL domain-containing protein [Spirochaetales bacterium]
MEEHIIIGDKIDFERDIETTFEFNFLPLDIFDNWSRVSSLSDFIAEYFESYFDSEAAHNVISTIFNEFIENAVKFTKNNSQPINIIVKKRDDNLISRITNTIPGHRKTTFIGICKELFTNDLDELFLTKIEEGSNDNSKSGIGLILIKKDYQVKTNFDFFESTNSANNVAVTFNLDLQ